MAFQAIPSKTEVLQLTQKLSQGKKHQLRKKVQTFDISKNELNCEIKKINKTFKLNY